MTDPEAVRRLIADKRRRAQRRGYGTDAHEDVAALTGTLQDLLTENEELRADQVEKAYLLLDRDEQCDATQARVAELEKALEAAREELKRWGWGDFHYGSQGQEQSVVDAVAAIDAVLPPTKEVTR